MESHFRGVLAAAFCALLAVTAVADCTLTASNTHTGPYDAGSTISLSASGDPSATYAWTGPYGYASADQSPMIANADLSRTGIYTVTSGECSATTSVVVSQPTITINNTSTKTGPKGTITQLTFHLMLSTTSTEPVSVEYYTSNSTAIAGRDYQVTSGKAVFDPGSTDQYVYVNIFGTSTNTQKALFLNLYDADNGAVMTIYG